MKKNILIAVIFFVAIIGIVSIATIKPGENLNEDDSNSNNIVNKEDDPNLGINTDAVNDNFIQCLADAGVVIYGSSTCPACAQLEEEYSGYKTIKPIYLDCSGRGTEEETQRCMNEMKTRYVPEIQIKGELFEGWGSPETLAEEVGCQL